MSDLSARAARHHADAEERRRCGDVEGALAYQRQAIALLRGTDEMAPLAHAIRHLADILVENGRAAEANASITEMLQIYASTTEAPPLDVANAFRSAALHAEGIGDIDDAIGFWHKARQGYAALETLFEAMIGKPGNPGVAEADHQIHALQSRPQD